MQLQAHLRGVERGVEREVFGEGGGEEEGGPFCEGGAGDGGCGCVGGEEGGGEEVGFCYICFAVLVSCLRNLDRAGEDGGRTKREQL